MQKIPRFTLALSLTLIICVLFFQNCSKFVAEVPLNSALTSSQSPVDTSHLVTPDPTAGMTGDGTTDPENPASNDPNCAATEDQKALFSNMQAWLEGIDALDRIHTDLGYYLQSCSKTLRADRDRLASQNWNCAATNKYLADPSSALLSCLSVLSPVSDVGLLTPALYYSPRSQLLHEGDSLYLDGAITGYYLTYQWYRNDVAIAGANYHTYSTTARLGQTDGEYYLKAWNTWTQNSPVVTKRVSIKIVDASVPANTRVVEAPPTHQTVDFGISGIGKRSNSYGSFRITKPGTVTYTVEGNGFQLEGPPSVIYDRSFPEFGFQINFKPDHIGVYKGKATVKTPDEIYTYDLVARASVSGYETRCAFVGTKPEYIMQNLHIDTKEDCLQQVKIWNPPSAEYKIIWNQDIIQQIPTVPVVTRQPSKNRIVDFGVIEYIPGNKVQETLAPFAYQAASSGEHSFGASTGTGLLNKSSQVKPVVLRETDQWNFMLSYTPVEMGSFFGTVLFNTPGAAQTLDWTANVILSLQAGECTYYGDRFYTPTSEACAQEVKKRKTAESDSFGPPTWSGRVVN